MNARPVTSPPANGKCETMKRTTGKPVLLAALLTIPVIGLPLVGAALLSPSPLGVAVAGAIAGTMMLPGVGQAQGLDPLDPTPSVPVLLVPGWGDAAAQVRPLAERLVEGGWSENDVLALSFADPFGSNEQNAREVAEAVLQLRELAGRERVDIVAHSMGGLAVRRFLSELPEAEYVRRVVFLATPHRGTLAAVLAHGEGGREMVPGSPFLEGLNGRSTIGESVELLSIRSPLDLIVIPGSSAMLPGAHNIEVCCPTHHGLLEDPLAFDVVRTFLLQGSAGTADMDSTIPIRTGAGWWESLGRGR